jgi:hypothetical protein
MGLTNPISQNFEREVASLQKQMESLSLPPQANLIDWFNINVSNVEYDSDNNITISESAVLSLIQEGDSIRIYQGGGYKYFYAYNINRSTGTLELVAGQDYTFDNTAFTQFAVSDKKRPSGFPSFFTYDSDIDPYSGASSTVSDTFSAKFIIDFPFVTVFDISILVTFNNSSNNGFSFDHPVGNGTSVPQPLQGFQSPAKVNISTGSVDLVFDAPFGDFSIARVYNTAAATTSFSESLTYTYYLDL